MTDYFISRHNGAVAWAKSQGVDAVTLNHLDIALVKAGDRIFGTLPVSIACDVCKRGGRYIHLSMQVPSTHRGKELSCEDMKKFGATLQEYKIQEVK